MADIIPFKGLRYNQDKISQLEKVVTPPYDVIDEQAQSAFYEMSPYNIIRLELGKTFSGDNDIENRYTRAAAVFRRWRSEGVLVQDSAPSFYVYQQQFCVKEETFTRTGFICGLKCRKYAPGAVLPHEETLPKAKKDRKQLMQACQANFSSIFGLYDEPSLDSQKQLLSACAGRSADSSVTDELGVIHRLWVVTDEDVITRVQRNMDDKTVYIADGHHRYETALAHAEEMAALGKTGYDHVMVTLVNLHDEGLVVLPTHRLVKNLAAFNMEDLVEGIKKYFDVQTITPKVDLIEEKLAQADRTAFVIYCGEEKAYLATLKPGSNPEQLHGPDMSPDWRRLDVSILHDLVLEEQLGIGSSKRASGDYIKYSRDAAEALTKVDNGEYRLSVLMRPTRVEQVTAVASAGDKMPQKSTYFYPKLVTGLVINPLGE